MKELRLALLASILLLSSLPLAADDWSQYRGPNRDGHATMFQVPETWPDAPKEVWKVEVGEGLSAPVISGDRIFLIARQGEDEVVMALNLSDGKTVWTKKYPAPYTAHSAAVRFGQGPRSTPIVADGTVCFLGVDARFTCHDAADGKELWQVDFTERTATTKTFCGSSISPLVHDGVLYAHLGDDLGGRLFAAKLSTGEELWGWEGQGPGYASPQIVEIDGVEQLLVFATIDLLGFDPKTGEVLWNLPYEDKWRENIVTPILLGERIIISDFENGTLSLWPTKGEKGWTIEQHWHNKELTQRMATPVTDGKVLYGFSDRRKGHLFVLDPGTGSVMVEEEGRGGDNAVLHMAGDHLFVVSTDASLRVLRLAKGALQEVKRYEIAPSAVWAEPAWLEDGMLVKDVRHLTRLSFEAPAAPPEAAE